MNVLHANIRMQLLECAQLLWITAGFKADWRTEHSAQPANSSTCLLSDNSCCVVWSLLLRLPCTVADYDGHAHSQPTCVVIPKQQLSPHTHALCRKQQEEGWDRLMRTYSTRRTFSQTQLSTAPSLPREPSTKYELTGQTGSLMYMSPEVFNQQRYNEKVSQPIAKLAAHACSAGC
jgi:hypothetical protein